MNSFEFERYEIRQSFWLFGTTIFIFEIFILILHISLLTLSSRFGFHDIIFLGLSVAIWEIIALHLFNTVVLFYKVLSWYSKYYTVGHHSIARAEGMGKSQKGVLGENFAESIVEKVSVSYTVVICNKSLYFSIEGFGESVSVSF